MRAGEAATSRRWNGIHDFIERELEVAAAQVGHSSEPDTTMLDEFPAETVLKNERERNERD